MSRLELVLTLVSAALAIIVLLEYRPLAAST